MTEPSADATNSTRSAETTSDRAVDAANTDRNGPSERWTKRVWSAGSYAEIAPNYVPMAGALVEGAAVAAGDAVLDVGCGTGSVAITAARRDARVTGVDITPELLATARQNAATAGRDDISWREGDATTLSFEAGAFDATLSNLGHMYGDPPDVAGRELLRVTRPGGRIAFTSWTPTSLYPAMAGVVTTFLSPEDLPAFSEPPFLWGDSGTVEKRLGTVVEGLEFETETVGYPALSPEHFLQDTATNSGLFIEVLEAVADRDRPALRERLIEKIEPRFDARRNTVELEYLRTTATVAESG